MNETIPTLLFTIIFYISPSVSILVQYSVFTYLINPVNLRYSSVTPHFKLLNIFPLVFTCCILIISIQWWTPYIHFQEMNSNIRISICFEHPPLIRWNIFLTRAILSLISHLLLPFWVILLPKYLNSLTSLICVPFILRFSIISIPISAYPRCNSINYTFFS